MWLQLVLKSKLGPFNWSLAEFGKVLCILFNSLLLGSAFGGIKGRTQLPGLVEDYMNGKIDIDSYVTHTFTLQDINKSFDAMHAGESVKSVVHF